MTRERAWPVRVMYILIAAALAMSLMILAAPAQKLSAANDEVEAEWDRVSTPTIEDWVVAPESVIIDACHADGGDVAYAVVEAYDDDCVDDSFTDMDYRLLKSDDSAATWDDITEALEDVDDENDISELVRVATDWEDPDFVAVALWEDGELRVYFSIDGGDSFEDAEWVEDGGVYFDDADDVSDLAVSYEEDDERDIAIGGVSYNGTAGGYNSGLFRCTVSGDNAGNWEDATEYDGWDDTWDPVVHSSELVTDIIFSPSWTTDKTILVTTVDVSPTWDPNTPSTETGDVHLQCGSWGTSPGWNEKSTLGIEAVPILENEDIPMWLVGWDARGIAGITLPEDYDSDNTADRILWVWVNYYDSGGTCMCQITRVEDDSAGPLIGGSMAQVENGELWLTNISYQGTIDEGKAIAGVLGTGAYVTYDYELYETCCEGVQVYRNDGISEMDICCERWRDACKPPTGRAAMAVSYVGEDKAYAVALQGEDIHEEGAWSVTFDDGDTWNQLSLIDTYIDYFSDVAVSPDCNKTMLVSVNVEKVCIDYIGRDNTGCDSVWLHAEDLPEAEEYSDKWLRTWCGELEGDWVYDDYYYDELAEGGMLRLAPEETTGMTVYLFDYGTSNVYWNDLETLACWEPIGSTSVEEIVDLAAQDADTVYALDADGDVSMFDDDEWYAAVESKVKDGYTIAVWGDHILVGGEDSDVSYSDDGGETFTSLEDVATAPCYVTVAFDSYFDTNSTIYAGLATYYDPDEESGVYRWIIDESETWKDLRVEPREDQLGLSDDDDLIEVNITGLVLDRPDPGNPMTSPDTGGVLYASYYGDWGGDDFTGVARYLTPAEDVVCKECGDWDYLIEGLTIDEESFWYFPDALKICGCLEATSNSKLFAIDANWYYDMCAGEWGAVWMFEDCYAKKAPDLTSPADGEVIDADPCSCYSEPFTLMWDRLCDACSYDLQIALDEDFDEVVLDSRYFCDEEEDVLDPLCHYVPPAGDAPAYHILGGMAGGLSCETTYYWRVRAADAETDQIIHSWWSDPLSFTVGPSVQAGEITLVSPEPGATGVAIKNVGFSWDLSAEADAFDWVLDNNSDLSSPVESMTGLTTKAYGCTQTLSYSTTYYWQVTAYNEGAEISTSAIGTFTTAATGQFCCPQCGLCFDTQEELEAHMAEEHPAQPATPTWVWIVIAIGAVLVIVVIVLIFRTRRV